MRKTRIMGTPVSHKIFDKAVDRVAVLLVFLLSLIPLAFKLLQEQFSVIIFNSDAVVSNIFFLFACAAGIITWRSGKHISLASLSDRLSPKAQPLTLQIRTGIESAVLTALFFASCSRVFSAFEPGSTVAGIPLVAVFAVLPLTYLALAVSLWLRKPLRASAFLGAAVGLAVSGGTIANAWYALASSVPPVFDEANARWCVFAGQAAAPLVLLLVASAFFGVPLFIVLNGVAYVAFSQGGGYVDVLPLESYQMLTDKTIAAIPLFTITGYVLSRGSAGRRLVDVFRACFGWFRGGAIVAVVVVATFFTTFTGVSGVTILALGSLLTVLLTGSGYPQDRARSLATASGAIGLLFPPSAAVIMYGSTNYFSVDIVALFKGALIPGCLLALGTIFVGFLFDKNAARPPFSAPEAFTALKNAAFEFLLPVFFCVGYFTGIFSLTESAAFAALYAIFLTAVVRRDFSGREALRVVLESIPVSGGVLFILASARGLSYFLMDANIPAQLSELVLRYVSSKYAFLLLLNFALIAVGCLMDTYSAILIVSPLVIAVAEPFGLSPVHTGVIFLMNMQLGFLTPPVGMDLFIASYTFNVPVFRVIRGVLPYLAVQFAVLLLVTYIPWFSTALQ
ncbi:TRAP transporter large permease subunit [Treponema endosymbiont of Eucomonympha sp.]|uniref:TRAP transporter large permease subunit n=1 Tax=Treponema endosymbiont of Eucomonympha sp. TaxID=1580831 RepID=UPI001E489A6F|nr:TRAP transporter large permease subunit [Treponema endosymbiont of Eucomonympha sp.]